jgi:hypothetical protein
MSTPVAAALSVAFALLVPTRAATAAEAPFLDVGRAFVTPPTGATVTEWSRHPAVDPAPTAAPDVSWALSSGGAAGPRPEPAPVQSAPDADEPQAEWSACGS